jgi:transcription antitermination factor NusG
MTLAPTTEVSPAPFPHSSQFPPGMNGREALSDLPPGDLPARAGSLNWYVLRVRSRHEQIVCDGLRATDVESFCPVFAETRQWTDRRKTKISPWFPSYVFARFNAFDRIAILGIRGVIEVLSLDQKPCPISDSQIQTLKLLADSPAPVLPHAYVVPGSTCRIKCGPFVDCVGTVMRIKGAVRLIVSIPMLGQSVSVELDSRDVEPDSA